MKKSKYLKTLHICTHEFDELSLILEKFPALEEVHLEGQTLTVAECIELELKLPLLKQLHIAELTLPEKKGPKQCPRMEVHLTKNLSEEFLVEYLCFHRYLNLNGPKFHLGQSFLEKVQKFAVPSVNKTTKTSKEVNKILPGFGLKKKPSDEEDSLPNLSTW